MAVSMDSELAAGARVISLDAARAELTAGAAAARPSCHGMPPATPLAMPTQSLNSAPASHLPQWLDWRVVLARGTAIAGTLAIIAYGGAEMLAIIRVSEPTILQSIMVVFFALTLSWIAQSAASAVAGLIPQRPLPLASSERPLARTALVMPIYNEDPHRTTAALQAMVEGLQARQAADSFEIVLLSDSTQADAWIRETRAVRRLRAALEGVTPVWYRRRWQNVARKAGNIQDFVERWGGRYEYMVILDADSLIDAATLVWMVRAMMADQTLGLLQTVPRLVGRMSLFARLQQFAGRVYGGVIARGCAAWAGDDGNYWGHNAILRVAAFAGCCGLPVLPGRKPFGGHILSHDFVEAALIRRAGWKVRMTDIGGSYEESPPSLIDVAIRDRRWAQGNLQHAKVLGAAGLRWHSRVHFAFGIMSYLSSPLWFMLLMIGLALAVQGALHDPDYFSSDFQLFPTWPRFDAQRMLSLFVFSGCVLFTPKLLGFLSTLLSGEVRRTVGVIRLTVSTAFELVLSALFAPVQMLMQSRYVAEILLGRDAGWNTQRRAEGRGSWREAWRFHWGHTLAGAVLGTAFWFISPPLFWWLSPALAGMVLAAPLSRLSGNISVGRGLARIGLLATPEEQQIPAIVRRRDELYAREHEPAGIDALRELARDERARRWHLELNPPPPVSPRGQPDPDRLTAEQKLREAQNLDEALAFLNARERLHVAADARLLHQLSSLP